MPDLELEVLGGFNVKHLGENLELTGKQKELLAHLLLGCDRDVVGEAIWSEVSPKKMRNNLNVLLNTLKKLLEPWGVATYLQGVQLTRTQADLWDLQVALKAGEAETVLNLYRGPFAPGLDLPLVNDLREKLFQDVVTCLLTAAQTAPPERARGLLERVLELEPLHERALQDLLELLLQKGRRNEAKRRFGSFAERLRREFGDEPLRETRALLTTEKVTLS